MYDVDEKCKSMVATIKKLCEEKNMTLHALAKEAGISTSTISYLINGKTKPQVYTVLMLCNVLDITISDLFDDHMVVQAEKNPSEEDKVHTEKSESVLQYITSEENTLLDFYRNFSSQKKELLRIYMDMLWQYSGEIELKSDEQKEKDFSKLNGLVVD